MPLPSTLVFSAPSRSNGVKSNGRFSAAMPGPVSATDRRTRLPSGESPRPSVTVPAGLLYFTALESKLSSTWRNR